MGAGVRESRGWRRERVKGMIKVMLMGTKNRKCKGREGRTSSGIKGHTGKGIHSNKLYELRGNSNVNSQTIFY